MAVGKLGVVQPVRLRKKVCCLEQPGLWNHMMGEVILNFQKIVDRGPVISLHPSNSCQKVKRNNAEEYSLLQNKVHNRQ